ncbi:MAG: SWIM zinc finger family protein [Ilumatobacteraceae bacterium]
MGVVVIPGRFIAPSDDIGRLVNTMLGVVLAGAVERQRLQRARQLQADGAVMRLELQPGVMTARVQGSRPEPYSVRIDVATSARPPLVDGRLQRGVASSLVPDIGSLQMSCTCPAREVPCKHSVAALLALGIELQMRPALLLEWRCSDVDGADDSSSAEPGTSPASQRHELSRPALRLAPGNGTAARSRRGGTGGGAGVSAGAGVPDGGDAISDHVPEDHRTSTRAAAPPREQAAMAHPDWPSFVGSLPIQPGPVVPDGLSLEGRQTLGSIDLTAWLATAHAALRSAVDDR